MKKSSFRIILTLSAALCWSEFVVAQEGCTTGFETVDVEIELVPEHKSYEIIPGRYEWMDGEKAGSALTYRVVPASFEDNKTSLIAANMLDAVPDSQRQTLATESYPIAKFVPLDVVNGRTRVQVERPKWQEIIVPAQTKTFSVNRKTPCLKTASLLIGE